MSNTSMPANFLNRTALPSITGLPASGADIAQAQHGGAVGDHADQIAARGVVARGGRVGDDRLAGRRHAGRIGQRQVALRRHALGRLDREFSRAGQAVIVERGLAEIFVHQRGSCGLRRGRMIGISDAGNAGGVASAATGLCQSAMRVTHSQPTIVMTRLVRATWRGRCGYGWPGQYPGQAGACVAFPVGLKTPRAT